MRMQRLQRGYSEERNNFTDERRIMLYICCTSRP